MCLLYILLHCSLLINNNALTTLTYTSSSPPPSTITCDDATGCEITCTGANVCNGITIEATSASYLTITASGDQVLYQSDIHCPSNALCNIVANGAKALYSGKIYCGANGVCDISGGDEWALAFANIYAQTSTKLIVAADGGYKSFSGYVHCPRSQANPSCIIRLRSDSSPFWSSSTGGPIWGVADLFIDSEDDIEFQCDASTDWDALFGSVAVRDHSGTMRDLCNPMQLSYSSSDFFATNMLNCGTSITNKQCVPWDIDTTEAPQSTSISSETPTKSPTNLPTLLPSKQPTKYPTYVPTLLPSKQPTKQPIVSPITTILSTNNPSSAPTERSSVLPTKYPTQSGNEYSTTSHNVAIAHSSIEPHDESITDNKEQDDYNLIAQILIGVLATICVVWIVYLVHKYGFKKIAYRKSIDNMHANHNNEDAPGGRIRQESMMKIHVNQQPQKQKVRKQKYATTRWAKGEKHMEGAEGGGLPITAEGVGDEAPTNEFDAETKGTATVCADV